MQDLTEKILSLDLEAASALKDAKAASVDAKMSADKHADQKMENAQQLFEEAKKSEAKVLSDRLEEEKKRARVSLDQKIKDFDERVKVDAVVEYLVNVAKERVCP
jgi:hypothetical protein